MLTVNLGGTAYSIDRDGAITPDTTIARMVGDLLEGGEPIGPQIDEYVGIVGSLDQYPQSVIAAFLDVGARVGMRVGRVELPTDAVTAGLGEGGFDDLGNWHDPGSGEFAKKGTSTAKALVENLFRKLLADSKRKDGTDAVMLEAIPSIDLHPGDRVNAKWHDGNAATITAPDGRKVRVSWDLLAHPEAYAKVWTGEGRETPVPIMNELPDGPTISGKARWYAATVDGETYSPNVRTANPPKYMVLARDEFGWSAVGFSTADNEADARADAEAMAPKADEYRIVSDLVETDTPPPDTIRTVRRPSLAEEDEGYRNHRIVAVNDRPVGVVRQEDLGPDDVTGKWSTKRYDSVNTLGPFDTMIAAVDALVADAQAHPDKRPTDSNQTFTRTKVSSYSVEHVRGLVEKLNARAERKGLNGRVEMTVSEPYLITDPALDLDDLGINYGVDFPAPKIKVHDVTISATPVGLGGDWTFAGVVDYATLRDADQGWDGEGSGGVLLHSASGYQLPDSFREHAVCDDCGRVMPRNKLIVAADGQGNLTRLGTTCVVDVLGHDPAKLLWWESAVRSLSDDEDEAWEKPAERSWTKQGYLSLAIVAIDMFGYGKAGTGDSTRDLILDAGSRRSDADDPRLKQYRERLAGLTDEDWTDLHERAEKIIEYINSDAFPKRSDFGQNMAAVLGAQFVTARTSGIAAYAPVEYNKAREKAEAEKAHVDIPNEWIGSVGDKVELTGTIRRINETEGYMGGTSYIVTVDTDQGTVKTFTSGAFSYDAQDALDGGKPIRFKGTVKDHGEWPRGSGNRETTLKNVTTVLTRSDRLRQEMDPGEAQTIAADQFAANLARFASRDGMYADRDGNEWADTLRPLFERLPKNRLNAISKEAQQIGVEGRTERFPFKPKTFPAPGSGLELSAYYIDKLPDGSTVAYPRIKRGEDIGDGPDWTSIEGVLTVVGGELVGPGPGRPVVVSAADIARLEEREAEWASLPRRTRSGAPDSGALPPARPEWTILTRPDDPSVWEAEGPITVSQRISGSYDNAVDQDYTIARDGTITTDGPEPIGNRAPMILRDALNKAERDFKTRQAEAIKEKITDLLKAEPQPEPGGDDGPTLSADWIDAGPWPQDYAYGARSKKTYRIEPGGDVYLNGKRVTDKTGDKVLLAALTDLGVEKPEEFAPVTAPEADEPIVNELVAYADEAASNRTVGSHEIVAIAGNGPHSVYLAEIRDTPATAVLVDAWRGTVDSPGAARGMQWAAAKAFNRPPQAPLGDTEDSDRAWLERVAQTYGITAFDPVETLIDLHDRTQEMLAENDIDPDDEVTLYRGITTHQFDEWDDHGRPEVMGSAPLAAYSPRFTEAAAAGKGGVMTVRIPAGNIVSLGALTGSNDEVIAFPPADGVPITRFRSAETDAAAAVPTFRQRIEAMRDESLAARNDLSRFVEEQAKVDPVAELRSGRKTGHWMWFVFPQIAGLSESAAGKQFEIRSLDQAREYLRHPVLGPNLIAASEALLEAAPGKSAAEILASSVDVMKLRSSMTLFARADPGQPVFQRVLDRFFGGVADARTDKILAAGDSDLASGSYYGAEYIPG